MKKGMIKEILVGDIETMLVNDVHLIVGISTFNGLSNDTQIINFECENLIDSSIKIVRTWIENLALQNRTNSTIYFHNLGKFDGYLLMKELRNTNKYKTKIIIRENTIYEITIEVFGKCFIIRDSYLMIPLSLKESGELFNRNYKKSEFAFNEVSIESLKTDYKLVERLKDYLENDTRTLYELLKRFEDFIENTFDKRIKREEILKRMTLYSLTQYIFLKHYYEYPFIGFNTRLDNDIRQGYLGGIVDVYKPYGKDLVMLDYNSMYPFIMKELALGIGRPKKVFSIENLNEFCKKPGFVQVEISCKDELRQPLISIKSNKKIIQPVGHFSTLLSNTEIKYCLDHYNEFYQFKPVWGYYYENSGIVFKEFVETLQNKKEKNNNPLYKKMMNSLYGRFGMDISKSSKTAIISLDKEDNFLEGDIVPLSRTELTDDYVIYTYKDETWDHESYAKLLQDIEYKKYNIRTDWAATITATGRIMIQNLKELVKVYYVDTDAIVIEKKDLEKIKYLIDDKALGKLKIVTEMDEAVFLAPKCYAYRNKGKYEFIIKGVNSKDIKYEDKELFEKFLAKLERGSTDYLEINRVNNFKRDAKTLNIGAETITLNFTLEYDKREKVYNEEGIWVDTRPLRIEIKEEENNKT